MGLRIAQNYNPNAPQNEDEQNRSQGPVQAGGAPPPPQSAAGQVSTKGPTKSGRFVNIQRYLQASRPGVQRLGQATTQQIGAKEQEAQQAQQQAQSAFGQAVERSRQGVTQAGAQQAVERIQQAPAGMTEEQMAEAQKLYNIQYGGPRQLADIGEYGQALSASEQSRETGQLAQGEGGRFQLLRQQFAQPQYTRGQTALDVALLGSDTGTSEAVTRAGQAAQSRGEALAGVAQSAAEQAGGTAKELEDIRKRVQETVGTETGRTEEAVQSALQRLQEERSSLSPKLLEALERGEISQELLDKTNLRDLANQELYGASFGSMIGPELTKETVASADEAARINALRKIAGQDPGYRSELAGTVDRNQQFKFDIDKIKRQMEERKGQYEKAVGSAAQEYERAWMASDAGRQYQYQTAKAIQEQRLSDLLGKQLNEGLTPEENAEVTSLSGQAALEVGNKLRNSDRASRLALIEDLAQRAAATRAMVAPLEAARVAQGEAARRAVGQQFGLGRQLRILAGG